MASASKRLRTVVPGMDRVKPVNKRKSIPKKKVIREIKVMPRLRLEPRLSEPEAIIKKGQSTENHSFVKTNEPEVYSCVPFEDGPIEEIEEQIVENDREVICEKLNDTLARSSPEREVSSNAKKDKKVEEEVDESLTEGANIESKKTITGLRLWDDRELMNLAVGLQSHGFGDLNKVADIVKTRNERDIREFVKNRVQEVNRRENASRHKPGRHKRTNSWYCVASEHINAWPTVRKWRKMACDQMLSCIRRKDYSRFVLSSLFQKFYEEEKEPVDPQLINVKAVYKYLLDCVNGYIPAQLPPKESALVISLLKEVRGIPASRDLREELAFLQNYKGATKFRPIHVKDEFKKRFTAKTPEDSPSNVVSVAESVFMDLSRHKRIVQSFNSLVTPVWMLHLDQEFLGKYINEDVNNCDD